MLSTDEATALRGSDDLSEFETRFYREMHNEDRLPYIVRITRPTQVSKDIEGFRHTISSWTSAAFARYMEGQLLIIQACAVLCGAYLTRAVSFYGLNYGIFLAYAIVSTGGSALAPQLSPAFNVGVFAGMSGLNTVPGWDYFTLLAFGCAGMWALFVSLRLLVGFGGRLGTCVFIVHNLVTAIVICPAGAASWSIFASDTRSYTSTVTWQLAVSLIVAVPSTVLIGLGVRRLGHSLENPVVAGNVTALMLMLVVASATESTKPKWPWTNDVLKGTSPIACILKYLATYSLPYHECASPT